MANLGDGIGVTQRVQKTTIARWVKKMSDLTTRKLAVLAKLEKSGGLKYGQDGGQVRWIVDKAEHALNPFVDARPVNFQRFDNYENAFLPWRGYYLNDFITRQEKLENGGPSAMLKIFEGRSKKILRSARNRLNYEIYKDGGLAAGIAANRFHGIESFMGITTGSQTAGDVLATVNADTYANLSTAINGLSQDAALARMWTPVIVNSNRDPGSGTIDWDDGADEYLRAGILRTQYGPGESLNLITLTQSAYEDLMNILDGKERIQVARGTAAQMISMGFPNTIEIDGVACLWDVAVPTTDDNNDVVYGYGWTTDMLEFLFLGPEKQIFKVDVNFSSTFQGDEIFVWTLGNMKFESPRHFAKWAAISA